MITFFGITYQTMVRKKEKNIDLWRLYEFYADLERFPDMTIASLPEPFSNPDLIIVEMAYPFAMCKIREEIIRSKIPYIIVPRGEFTTEAQSKKWLKKKVGNLLLGYYRFAQKAVAIQCLTKAEKDGITSRWSDSKIVIPNGTFIPKRTKEKNLMRVRQYAHLLEEWSRIRKDLIYWSKQFLQ